MILFLKKVFSPPNDEVFLAKNGKFFKVGKVRIYGEEEVFFLKISLKIA